jgi:hypothetical protein
MRITVHIEQLVLDGIAVAHADVPRLGEALEQDLARLLEQGGLAPGLLKGATVATLTGSTIEPAALPGRLAEQIAGAVCAAIGHSGLPTPSPALPAGDPTVAKKRRRTE